ncbi:MAG: squalene/phytoene synthase family protein [Gammaproteobacteria bacterium]
MSYGPDRDWLLRFCAPEQAAALTALFTVEQEVLASLRGEFEHQVAHARLEWWHEELTRLAAGAARHPATRALTAAAARQHRSPPDLRSLTEHVRVDLAGVAFLTRDELDQHLQAWGSSVFREAALIANAPAVIAEQLASRAGSLVRELELLAEFSRHARAGRIYRPLSDPADSHMRWQAEPLGAAERADIAAREQFLLQQLCAAATATTAAARPGLRVPLLWMSYAVERSQRADSRQSVGAALRRALSSWRSALALSRGKLPRALRC